jgi:AAA+ ATPase superfamily predicted ATPase
MFCGREQELALLQEQNWRDRGRLVVVYGRRRIGKTALIEKAYNNEAFWKFEGLEGLKTAVQLQLFSKNLQNYTQNTPSTPVDWIEAFEQLTTAIASYFKNSSQRLTIFIDEFQWMCEMKPELVSIFKNYWDNHFSKFPHVNFILCGSISSFIVGKVVRSKALYGRVDIELNLKALSYEACNQLLKATPLQNDLMTIFMTFGGVPQYLKELNPSLSLQQNLIEFAFKPSGYFFQEYTRLFISHFGKSDIYEKILSICAKHRLGAAELAAKCKVSFGGSFSNKLKELEDAGFIKGIAPVGRDNKSKDKRYVLYDEYLFFYFQLILPNAHQLSSGQIDTNHIFKSKAFQQWRGYAFERLCHKMSSNIADALRFSAIDYHVGPWFKRAYLGSHGTQIDLMFIRADKVITVCEIKTSATIQTSKLIKQIEQQRAILEKEFPKYFIEWVLVVPEERPPLKIDEIKTIVVMENALR